MGREDRIWAPESSAYDAFFKAARGDNVRDLETALTPEIDINALHGDGWEGEAALHMAASSGTIETLKFLLARGADVNILDETVEGSDLPLHMAACSANRDKVKLLLDSGSERDRKGMCERTPLHMVLWGKRKVEPHHVETITLLLDYGLDINESGVASDHYGFPCCGKV
jgi:ankyrin repeat protein